MTLKLILISLALFPVAAEANGRDAALGACDQITFRPDRDSCRRTVATTGYWDEAAANFCRTFNMNNEIIECIGIIADKIYTAGEVRSCSSESFDKDKLECMSTLGREARSYQEVRTEVEYAIRQLRENRPREAEATLQRLLSNLPEKQP